MPSWQIRCELFTVMGIGQVCARGFADDLIPTAIWGKALWSLEDTQGCYVMLAAQPGSSALHMECAFHPAHLTKTASHTELQPFTFHLLSLCGGQ